MTGNRWKEAVLGDLVEISHGYPFASKFFTIEPTARLVITPGNFKIGGGFNGTRLTYYNDTEPFPCAGSGSDGSRYILEPDDIVVALTDLSREAGILGCSARVPDRENKLILQNQRIGKVSIISEGLSPRFLYWLLRTHLYRRHVIGAASGTTVRHTTPDIIKSYRFYLPSIEKQESIAGVLDSLESRIRLLEECNRLYEAWVVNLCGRWFRSIRRTAPLSDFGRIVCGKTPSKGVSHYFGGSIPFIKIPDMRNRVYVTGTEDTLTAEGAAVQASKQIPPNSVCVSCIATVGLTTLTASWSYTNQQINTIIPRHHYIRYYLYCTLKTGPMIRHLQKLGNGGSAIPNLNTRTFSRVRIPRPPKQRLREFHEVTHTSFHRILLNSRKAEKLIAYRDSLLPRLMTGKLPPGKQEVLL
jgi:type I restriction enzyme S subunit